MWADEVQLPMLRPVKPRMATGLSLVTLFLSLGLASDPAAGPHAGGTLLVHVMDGAYTGDVNYCGVAPLSACDEVDTRVDEPTVTNVWSVYAAFAETSEPELRGVEFGIEYSGAIALDTFGHCGDYENSQGSPWPASGSGTRLVWLTPQTEHLVEVYWFTGYTYSLTGGISFQLTPYPYATDAYFADDSTIPFLDPVAGLGRLGFSSDGFAPCPAAAHVLLQADGSGDFSTIQEAVRYLAPGSVVELADGVYRGQGNIDVAFNQGLTIRSQSGDPAACVIDIEGDEGNSHRAFLFFGSAAGPVVIERIGFVNGYAGSDLGNDSEGGAIKLEERADAVIRGCIFENCTARQAGAVHCDDSKIVIEDCVFRGNRAYESLGGGFEAGGQNDITVARCLFEGNESANFGGAFSASSGIVRIEDCRFRGNSAVRGGAVCVVLNDAVLRGCSLTGNSATYGGALYGMGAETLLDDCTIADNHAPSGGAIYCDDLSGSLALDHSIVTGASANLFRCGAASWSAQTTCIWNEETLTWPPCLAEYEGIWGNLLADPLFCGTPGSEFYLDPSSLCAVRSEVGRGVPGAWPVGCQRPIRGPLKMAADVPARRLEAATYPNPFGASTSLSFHVGPEAEDVQVSIFDLSGRHVATLFQGLASPGAHELDWNGQDGLGFEVPTGSYFARIRSGTNVQTVRLLRLR